MASSFDRPKVFRYSIIDSLRSASPFSSVNVTLYSSSRAESLQTGRDTPVSIKETMAAAPEYAGIAKPELDRSVDLFVVSETLADQKAVFGQLLPNHNAVHEHHVLFTLPITVRRRIYDYCLPDETRKISLSPRFASKAAFPDGYFASPWDVLDDVMGGLQAFQELRRELMIYFWTKYHFHVTLSQFTGPKFSPLSHVWLCDYLDIVQYLTVEVDLTRFGFSALKVGAKFGHDVNKTEGLMISIVEGLVKRRGRTTMAELNMMCRRYAGFRPYDGPDDATFVFEAVPYCPDEALYLCDAICSLRGILQKSRISGFTLEYTEMLLRAIFAHGGGDPDYSPAKECAWPEVPIQTPYENFIHSPKSFSTLPVSPSQFELPLTPTSSFAQDVEDEMLKYESSVYSDKTAKNAEDASHPQGLHIPRSETSSTLADHAQAYQECVGSMADFPLTGGARFSDASRIRFSDNDSLRHLLAATPTIDSRCSTPKTPNEMNRINEQDPAFVRSLNEEPRPVMKTRPKSMIPSPMRKKDDVTAVERSVTSQEMHPTPAGGTVRRYLSFVKRIRGRTE